MIEDAMKRHPYSMAEAAKYCNLPFGTFKYRAIKLGLYHPNQSGKGRLLPNKGNSSRVDIKDVVEGRLTIRAGSCWLKHKLFKAQLLENVCNICGMTPEWNGEPLSLHLDHIDGDNRNNILSNLQILCPNCHSQTETYAGRNKKNKKDDINGTSSWLSDDIWIEHLQSGLNIYISSFKRNRGKCIKR